MSEIIDVSLNIVNYILLRSVRFVLLHRKAVFRPVPAGTSYLIQPHRPADPAVSFKLNNDVT